MAAGFSAGAAGYEAGRPGYPPAALDVLAERAGLGPGRRVLDLAAGTGKLTRQLLATGADVVAVEPLAGMRAAFHAAVPGVDCLDGTAEAIPVEDGSVEVVTVAQAFHWFDTDRTLDEIARVLRPGGWLAVIWNEHEHRPGEPGPGGWDLELATLSRELSGYRRQYPGDGWDGALVAGPRFATVEHRWFPNRIERHREAVVAEVASRSYMTTLDPGRRRDVLAAVEAFLDEHPETAGRARLVTVRPCGLYLCRRPA